MTDVLRETLEERGRANPWDDVDGLMAAGDRRVRRRRVAGAVATVAVVVALAVVAPFALGGLGRDDTQVADTAYDTGAPSWAVDGTVRVGDLEVDLGEQPGGYVLTDAGVVWIDSASDVRLTTPSGDTETIGASDDPAAVALVTDGRYVAWVDRDAEELVAYDTAARVNVHREGFTKGGTVRPQLIALDGRELWTYNPATRTNRSLDLADPDTRFAGTSRSSGGGPLLDVAGDYKVTSDAGRRVVVVSTGATAFARNVPGRGSAILSPDATYVVTQPRRKFVVYDVEEGLRRVHGSPGSTFVPVRWLDDGTLENLGAGPDRDGPIDVLTCDIPDLACETVAEDVAPSLAEVTVADGMVDSP